MADKIVVLGAGGFIGRRLCERWAGREPVIAVTREPEPLGSGIEVRALGDLGAATDWRSLFAGARAVIHLANRAHAPAGRQDWLEAEVAMAAAIARAARAEDARLLYMSSIKVHGEASRTPFRASDTPHPADAYGRAKWQSESAMRETGVALSVIRPPLVYGPGVKANFLALLRWVDRGLPLPLASIDNRRSLIFLDNLLDLVDSALAHEPGLFLARDDDEVSTPALIRIIAEKLGRPARLVPCPPAWLAMAVRCLGQGAAAERLLGTLSLDDGATRQSLGWRPKTSLADGIAATCRWYRSAGGPAHSRL